VFLTLSVSFLGKAIVSASGREIRICCLEALHIRGTKVAATVVVWCSNVPSSLTLLKIQNKGIF